MQNFMIVLRIFKNNFLFPSMLIKNIYIYLKSFVFLTESLKCFAIVCEVKKRKVKVRKIRFVKSCFAAYRIKLFTIELLIVT